VGRAFRALVAVALVVAASGADGCSGPLRRPRLVVEDLARGRVLHTEPVTPGDAFVLAYVHSSEHVPVRGTFRVGPDRTLRVTETAFAGFGPGLPAPGPGDAWEIRDGMITVRHAEAPLPEIVVRVVPLTRHRLRLPSGRELDLSALMGAGGAVRLVIE
jgi:hypothetical protein